MKIASRTTVVRSRKGFTLLELLVVISIIAVLLALSTSVYYRVLNSQSESNTASAVTRIQKVLSTQYNAVLKLAHDEPLPPPPNNTQLTNVYNNIVSSVGTSDKNLIRVIWVKLRLRQAFPIDFDEAINTVPFPSLYATKLNAMGVTGSSNPVANFESSACLLLALQRSVSGGVPVDQVSKLTTQLFPASLGATPTVPVLVDPFNTPLAFCRWPTGYVNLNPSGPQGGSNDPEDPGALLTNPGIFANKNNPASGPGDWFNTHVHAAQPNLSFKLQPTVVSAGPDYSLGLDPTTFTTLSADANDNIVARTNP